MNPLDPHRFHRTRRAIGIAMLATIMVGIGAHWYARLFTRGTFIAFAVVPCVTIALAGAIWIIGTLQLRPWRRRLLTLDFRVCRNCGYELRGLPDRHTCPECGVPYEIQRVRAAWADEVVPFRQRITGGGWAKSEGRLIELAVVMGGTLIALWVASVLDCY